MKETKRGQVATILEQRITRAVASGALRPGDRLPSTRKVAADLGADPRAVASAYRDLGAKGLVTLTPRSGVYLSKSATVPEAEEEPSEAWLVEAISEAVFHGSPLSALSKRMEDVADHSRLRAVVITLTMDQALGLCRELHNDYGLETSYILSDSLDPDKPIPRAIKSAQLLVSTENSRELVEALAKRLKKIALIVRVRPDIILAEWVMLLQHPVYVVGMDTRLLDLIKAYLIDIPGSANMVMMIAGKDDLSGIPEDAPTYVTEAARRFLGKTNIPGRLIKPGRLLSRESVVRLVKLIVEQSA